MAMAPAMTLLHPGNVMPSTTSCGHSGCLPSSSRSPMRQLLVRPAAVQQRSSCSRDREEADVARLYNTLYLYGRKT